MAAFSNEQLSVGQTIYRVGVSMGVSALQMRAAFAAAWVESRFKNLNYGDRDSLGVFQQRPSQGWGSAAQATNVEYAARKFFSEAAKVSQSGTPGQLAQRVQRSGFPARYDEQIADADQMLATVSNGSFSPSPQDNSMIYAVGALIVLALLL